MDANQNGILEPNEISDNRRGFVNAIASRLGVDPNRPINLADLERRAEANYNTPSSNSGSSGSSRSESGGTGRSSATPVIEPLVPPFGEQRPTETPVLEFGQREKADSAPAATAKVPATAPQNQPAQMASKTTGQSATYDRLPPGARDNRTLDWFFEYDKDRDGQLTMQEYCNGRGGIWTPQIANEFQFLDRNGDGFATIDEVLLSLKDEDERRTAVTAKSSQEVERPRRVNSVGPSGSSSSASPSENQGNQPSSTAPWASTSENRSGQPSGMANPQVNSSNGRSSSEQSRRPNSRSSSSRSSGYGGNSGR